MNRDIPNVYVLTKADKIFGIFDSREAAELEIINQIKWFGTVELFDIKQWPLIDYQNVKSESSLEK